MLTVVTLPMSAANVGLVVAVLEMVLTHLVMASVAVGLANAVFYHLLERPNLGGGAFWTGSRGSATSSLPWRPTACPARRER